MRTERRVDYGLDAPAVLMANAIGGVAAFATAIPAWSLLHARHPAIALPLVIWLVIGRVTGIGQAALMWRSSRVGKLRQRDRVLGAMPWRGDELVLEVGRGRGLMLIGGEATHYRQSRWARPSADGRSAGKHTSRDRGERPG